MKNGVDDSAASATAEAPEASQKVPSDQQKQAIAMLQNTKAFADIIGILLRSSSHRHLFITDLEWMVLPALALRQYRIFHDGKRPVAFALWARLSEDSEKAFVTRGSRLRPAEWRSGDRYWLIDLVGTADQGQKIYQQLMADLVKGPFDGKEVKMHVFDRKTGQRRVVQLGPKVSKKQADEAASAKASDA